MHESKGSWTLGMIGYTTIYGTFSITVVTPEVLEFLASHE